MLVHYQILFSAIADFIPDTVVFFFAIHHLLTKKDIYLVSLKRLVYPLIFGCIIYNGLSL